MCANATKGRDEQIHEQRTPSANHQLLNFSETWDNICGLIAHTKIPSWAYRQHRLSLVKQDGVGSLGRASYTCDVATCIPLSSFWNIKTVDSLSLVSSVALLAPIMSFPNCHTQLLVRSTDKPTVEFSFILHYPCCTTDAYFCCAFATPLNTHSWQCLSSTQPKPFSNFPLEACIFQSTFKCYSGSVVCTAN